MLGAHLEGQLQSFLSRQPVLAPLGDAALADLVRHLELVSFRMGETVCAEGDAADCVYLIYSGKARAFKQGPAGRPVLLGTLFPGDLFGEQALARGQTRTASVRAAEDLMLMRLGRAAFEKLLHDHAGLAPYLERLERQRAASNFLRLATFLGALPARQVVALLDRLEECQFPAGSVVVRQGEAGDRLYIVKSGEARVVRGDPGREAVLAYLGQGDYFGERALILEEPRYASVVAVTGLECFSLSREALNSLLTCAPQLYDQFRRRLEQYQRDTEAAARPAPGPPPAEVRAESPPADLTWEPAPTGQEEGPRRRRSWLDSFKRFPFVAQEDETDCGAASLAMIARHHGRRLSVAWLRERAHVGAGGASMLGLTRAAEAAGFRWRAVETDFAHLAGLSLPAIAHWKGHHYLVLYESRGDRVRVADPAAGRLRMRRQEFEAHWTGKLLLLTPAGERGAGGAPAACRTPGLATLAPVRGLLAAALLPSLLLALLLLLLPLAARQVVDGAVSGRGTGPLPAVAAGLLLGALAAGAAALVRQRLLERAARTLARTWSADWSGRLLRLPLRFVDSRPLGTFLTRLDEIREAENVAARLAVAALFDLPLLAGSVALLFLFHPGLALAALLAFAAPAVLAVCSWPGWRRDRQNVWLAKTAAASLLAESLRALPAIKGANAEASVGRKLADLALAGPAPGQRLAGAACWPAVLLLAGALVLGYGAVLDQAGQRTAGELAASILLIALAAVPVAAAAGLGPQLLRFDLLRRRLAEAQEIPAEEETASPPLAPAGEARPAARGLVRLDGVGFRYHPESPGALAGLNLAIPAGQVVAILGRAGAGKTTLALLLQGLYQPTEGKVILDGIDLAAMPPSTLRAQVGLVGHEPALLAATVRDNIALADPDAPLDRVIEAARLANAHDFILAWPQGYDMLLGPGGARPSAGQAQALGLARALLKEPRLLILDDVLAGLDPDAEAVLVKNLRAARRRTTLLLSRRPLPPAFVDWIVVLDAGRVVEVGTHRELLDQKGLYSYWTARA